MFADPILSKQMAQGKLTKSSIDRFTIVLMGGIAAEAINYGNSEVIYPLTCVSAAYILDVFLSSGTYTCPPV